MLQDETELSQWKQLLGRDIEILKAKANFLKIQSVSVCCEVSFFFIYRLILCGALSVSLLNSMIGVTL
jgi:hypothetical protein